MKLDKTHFERQIDVLVNRYGKLEFFEKALDKQKVTKHMVVQANNKNFYESTFFYLISLGVFVFGFTGFFGMNPKEVSFLIPIGLVMFGAVYAHARKVKIALRELSKLAVGIHAKKLADIY